jgi:hypothetical protein
MRQLAKEGASELHLPLMLDALDPSATLVFSMSGTEDRAHAPLWTEAVSKRPNLCIEVVAQEPRLVVLRRGVSTSSIPLTDVDSMSAVLSGSPVYIDVTGLAHHIWAPLLRVALKACSSVRIIYFEPQEYKAHPTPTSTSQFDLSS